MPQRPVEIVVLKQLASCLDMPMFVVGTDGDLLYFNEPAELILGRRFDETGELSRDDWLALLQVSDDQGAPLKVEERALVVALERRRPAHRRFWMRGFDGTNRRLEGTALPLIARDGDGRPRMLGALALFWDLDASHPSRSPARSSRPRPRGQHAVETILTRRLASFLSTPIFLVDEGGRLLYFNDAAAPILGCRFHDFEDDVPTREALYESFRPRHEDGRPLDPAAHPLTIARSEHRPVNGRSSIRGLDGVVRSIEVTAIPLIGQSGRSLGAVGIFWESPEREDAR